LSFSVLDLGFSEPETGFGIFEIEISKTGIGIFETEFSETQIEIFEIGIFEFEILKMRF
jgi:hypothetical protein